jgi:transcriptional regulator with XRE-family HTH domain
MNNIKESRMRLNVSQRKLSLLTGISTYRISSIECAYIRPTNEELCKIQKALSKVQKELQTLGFGGCL